MSVKIDDNFECNDRKNLVSNNGTLNAWHFIGSQIVLFIAVVSFCGVFIGNLKAELKDYAYPKLSGEFLQTAITELTLTVKQSNELLTKLRIDLAGEHKKR